jgi:hypothetical protein
MQSTFSDLGSEMLFPSRRETVLPGRRLTKREQEESIINNRSGRATYAEEKSVLTS